MHHNSNETHNILASSVSVILGIVIQNLPRATALRILQLLGKITSYRRLFLAIAIPVAFDIADAFDLALRLWSWGAVVVSLARLGFPLGALILAALDGSAGGQLPIRRRATLRHGCLRAGLGRGLLLRGYMPCVVLAT